MKPTPDYEQEFRLDTTMPRQEETTSTAYNPLTGSIILIKARIAINRFGQLPAIAH